MLGNNRKHLNRHPIRVRVVYCDELNAGLHQDSRNEDTSRTPIKLRDDEDRLRPLRMSDGPLEPGSVRDGIALSGLYLRVRGDDLGPSLLSDGGDQGSLLRLKAQL